ncbi:hypothetical protein [Nocardioides jejuensis]|uniref:Uncharacterized protein n=1 Tax=Nocardioides jejuensis TaxID=2502782 RepID=A0A4R1BY95_9ACTN|nr:hypothetical protein [Nocardioides jejuensis]TCJ23049.1 hypothetical protein EPD65_11850 [Nocardioides jejuensis]
MSGEHLDLVALVEPTHAKGATHAERFAEFHRQNPWVLAAIERLIGEWIRAGHVRVGIGAVWERIRWEYGMTTGDTFKANNNHRSHYARLVLERHPEWASAIETRELRAA